MYDAEGGYGAQRKHFCDEICRVNNECFLVLCAYLCYTEGNWIFFAA